MIKNEKLFYGILVICVLVIGGISLFVYLDKTTFILPPKEKEPGVEEGKCGIENCHGLDITCGPNIPEVCTMEYAFGDGCRQYASCQIINGECQLIKSEKFEECKSCVEKCLQDFKEDIIKASECEGECRDF